MPVPMVRGVRNKPKRQRFNVETDQILSDEISALDELRGHFDSNGPSSNAINTVGGSWKLEISSLNGYPCITFFPWSLHDLLIRNT